MMKKIILLVILLTSTFFAQLLAQPITVTGVAATGRFTTCNLGLPDITATLLSSTGTSIVGGQIVCSDPCGTSTIRVAMTNVRWNQTPGVNWIHGIFFPTNSGFTVSGVTLPAGWSTFTGVTGAPCSAAIVGGPGFYYDQVNSNSCCPGNPILDGIPANNWGDGLASCTNPAAGYNFTFDLVLCNSAIIGTSLLFKVRGTADGGTGCWSVPDNSSHNIQFSIGSVPCISLYTPLPTATAPVKTCLPSLNYTSILNGACGNSNTITWWTAQNGGTQVGTGSPFVYDPPGAACPSGTTLYAACCPTGNTCATRRAFGIPGPCAAPLAIDDVTFTNPVCPSQCGDITATITSGSVGVVTYTLMPANITNTTGVFNCVTGTNHTITATDADGCSASYNVVFTIPTCGGPTTAPISYCLNAPALPLTATLTSGGTNLLWYTSLTGGVGNSTAPTPSTLVVGPTTYYVTQSILGVESTPRTPLVVTIVALPAPPTVVPVVAYCQNATAVALTATGTNLLWYNAATGGTGSSTAPIPATTVVGSTIYYVSQTVTPCESPRAAITVTITALPPAPLVTTPVTYCQNATAVALTATGTNLLWYTAATGGTSSATAPIPTTTAPGSTTYYVSQTVATCEGPRAAIVVNITATPAAPTVTTPITYCQNATAVALTATGTNLLWYTAATGGTGSTTAPTPNTTTAGSTIFYVSQTITTCESPRAAITVNITATPANPTVTTPVTYCQNDVATALTATGTGLLWYTVSTGGVGSATAPTPITTAIGSTNYYVSQTISNCESNRATIVVTIVAPPATPTVTTPVTYCQGATATALTATGTNLQWYTVPTGGVALAGAPTPSTTTTGSTIYYVSQTAGTCVSPRAAITVTINPTPTAPTVTTPVLYCQNDVATPLTATGTNLQWYTVATGGTALAGAPTPSTTTIGSTIYYVSSTQGICEGPRAAITVTISTTPIAPTVISPVFYCQNATAVALTATGSGLLYYTTATGGIGATSLIPPTTALGSITYYVSASVGTCEGPRAAITVTVNAIPAAPTVTTPVTYCQNEVATALTASGANLLWYANATGGTGSATAPTPLTTTSGNTTYYVSQTINNCESPRASITVTVNPTPAAPIVTTPVAYCQGATATALTATGTNLLWYNVATGGTGSTTAPTPLTTTGGTTTFYVSQNINNCEGPRAAIVVNVTATPAAPTVTSPVIYCQNVTASALTATGSNLLWYSTATGGTSSATAPIPNTSTVGNTSYWVSQTINTCEGPRAEIVVTANAIPPAPAAASLIAYCQNATATPLTATGSNLLWYTVASGGIGITTAPTPITTIPGNTTYYVSQTINNCESPRSAILITINATPAAPIVTTPVAYCQGVVATPLTANGTNLLWYTVPTGGVSSTTAPTPLTTIGGSTTYYVSQTLNNCEGPRAAITVNVTATPAAPTVTSPVIYCQNATASALTATGSNLLWYSTATGGTSSATAPIPNTSTVGNTSYWVSQTINTCEGPRAEIVVTINAIPAAPTVTTPIIYCQNEVASILTATGNNLLWYANATGGTGSSTAPTPSTVLAGSTNYYVTQTINNCESPRAVITVTINPTPAAPTVTTPIAYCQGATATVLTATGTNILWYATATGGVGATSAPTPITTVGGSFTFYVSQTVSNCESPRAAIVVNVTATPAAPTVTSPVIYCQNATAVALTATGSNLLWYSSATGGTSSATAPIPITSTVGNTSYWVSQTINTCEGPRAEIVVTINTTPLAPIAPTPIVYCQNATAVALTATGANLLWYTSATGGVGSTTAPIPSTTIIGNTIYYVSQTLGICESPRTAITVTVNITPAAPTAASPIPYCQGATATQLIAIGNNLLWYITATGGVGSTTAPTPSTATAGATTFYVSSTIGNCEGPRKAIIVNVTAIPAAPTVTSPVVYCQGRTATALTATGTNLLWYINATGGTGSTVAPLPSTTTVGNTSYYVSQSVNNCEGPRAEIVVTINITPAAPIVTTPITYCQNTPTIPLTATGTNLLWYATATGGIGSSTAPTPSSAVAGSFNFYVSQTTGICEGPRALINVIINATPALPTATSPIAYCQGATATPLVATGTNLLWYTVATGGVSSTTAPTPLTSAGASTTYYVSQTINNCEGPRRAIVVNVTTTPLAPTVTTPVTYCQNATATALTATGTNLLWYTVPTGGAGLTTAPIPTTTAAGTTTYYVSQSTNGCEGPRAAINVVVNPTPSLPTNIFDRNYCQNSTAVPLTATGTNLLWYNLPTGGTSSTTAPTPSTTVVGTTTYYVSQTSLNCQGPRAAILVTITAVPAAPTVVSPISYCPGDPSIPLTAVGNNLLWYANATGGVGNTTAPTPSTATPGSYNFYVTQSNIASPTLSCESPRALITVNINNNNLTVSIGADTTICEGETVKFDPIVTPAAANYEWRAIGVPASTIDSRNTRIATVKPVDNATYILKATNGGCSTEDTVNVLVRWKPILDAGLNKAICLNDRHVINASLTHFNSSLIKFLWSPKDSLSSDNTLSTIAYPTKTTWYKITATTTKADYGCDFTVTDSIKIIVQPTVKAFAGKDTIAVKGVPHQLNGSGGLNYVWSSPSGALINNPFNQIAFATLTNDANFYLKVSDAVGCAGYDSIFVKVYNGPTYYVPNSFSPNGDGLNDIFRAIPVGMTNTVYFRVFNRYGELVFETNQWLKGWDGTFKGKEQPNGTYVWTVGGTSRDNKKIQMNGTVNLVR